MELVVRMKGMKKEKKKRAEVERKEGRKEGR